MQFNNQLTTHANSYRLPLDTNRTGRILTEHNENHNLCNKSLINTHKNIRQNKQNQQHNSYLQLNQHLHTGNSHNNQINTVSKGFSVKEDKIMRLRQQINRDEDDCIPAPSKLRQKIDPNRSDSTRSLLLQHRPIQKKRQYFPNDQCLFSPKILNRSQSMMRNLDVSTILYQDALRRQQKQFQSQQMNLVRSPKINKNTNILVTRKILAQFSSLISQQEIIQPLNALLILQQIFNIDLNFTKSHAKGAIVEKIFKYIVEPDGQLIIRTQKLRDFILALMGDQQQNSCYSAQQRARIFQDFHYLYSERMTKQRKNSNHQTFSFKPVTLAKSSKLAVSFRQKTCQQIQHFIQKQQTNLRLRDSPFSIQDIFVMNHIKKKVQNQKKKIQKEARQLEKCTFKPNLSNSSSSLHLIRKKVKVILKAPSKKSKVKTDHPVLDTAQDTLNTTMIHSQKAHFRTKTQNHQSKQKNGTQLNLTQIRNMQKQIIRMSVGRQNRHFESALIERGYPEGQNWSLYKKYINQKGTENIKKLKGIMYK